MLLSFEGQIYLVFSNNPFCNEAAAKLSHGDFSSQQYPLTPAKRQGERAVNLPWLPGNRKKPSVPVSMISRKVRMYSGALSRATLPDDSSRIQEFPIAS